MMQAVVDTVPPSEEEFAALVDELAADLNQYEQLIHLLREEHPFYNQRGTATIVQMRGWVLLAIARTELSDDALVFVLEELDTGVDPYLVAAAASALRSYPNPNPALAPFVMRAVHQIRYHDDPVSLDEYGAYASAATSPLRELFKTLAWLGPHAEEVLPEIEAVARSGGLSKKALVEAERSLEAIRAAGPAARDDYTTCCSLPEGLLSKFSWSRNSRHATAPIESTVFEDQEGAQITFKDFFRGRPSIVVFFYTRCDNPLKCSLTVTKLARIQKLLEKQGLAEQIKTAAISYDPAFDLPARIRNYGKDRDVRMNAGHRLLRAIDGFDALRRHFKLGVNFIESLVNRHRIEAYILDAEGRIAASFERLHWDEQEVVKRAVEVLNEKDEIQIANAPPAKRRALGWGAGPLLGTLVSFVVAFFPKCPICWAAYLSLFGIAGLNQIPYSPWLQPILVSIMLINIASVWFRARLTGRMWGLYLVTGGAIVILVAKMGLGWEAAAIPGVVLTLAGSLLSAASSISNRRNSTGLLDEGRGQFSTTSPRWFPWQSWRRKARRPGTSWISRSATSPETSRRAERSSQKTSVAHLRSPGKKRRGIASLTPD